MHRSVCVAVVVAVCLLVQGPTPEAQSDPHAYFNALVSRGDHYKSFSLRPQAGQPITSPHYDKQLLDYSGGGTKYITYSPSTDPDPNRQDAAKVRIPAFYQPGSALASSIDATTTTIPLTLADGRWENQRTMKIDNEMMVVNGPRNGNSVPVLRGQHGTTAAAHSAGATAHLSVNSLMNQVRVPVNTVDGSTYLFTWDGLWTSSYTGTSLKNHKAFQIASVDSGSQWFEVQTRFIGPPSLAENPAWNAATDVAAATARGYSQYGIGVTKYDPLLPMTAAPFIIKPNRWTRFWIVVEANREGDTSKFETVTSLAAAVSSPAATTITINHPATLISNPFTVASSVAGPTWPGRTLRIGNEIMTIVSGPMSGTTRDIQVVRGAHGTTPGVHAAGAPVQLVHDYATMYMADEVTPPVMLYNRVPMHLPIDHSDVALRGSMGRFWFEYNTSTTELTRTDQRDLIAYVRNFAVLRNPSSISSLLLSPSAGVPPPYTGPDILPAPTKLRILR